MHRTLIAALALAASVGAALAETYSCRSLDGETPVTLDFTTSYSNGAYAVDSAAFQIEDDLGYSTTAIEPTSLATLTGADVSSESLRFSFHYQDADYDGDVATVHVVTLSEGANALTAGVLQVVGGGLWSIRCDIEG
jgi:hypothetical protein